MSDTLAQGRGAGGVLSYISLFTSFGTLLCCALPSLLVLLGLGASGPDQATHAEHGADHEDGCSPEDRHGEVLPEERRHHAGSLVNGFTGCERPLLAQFAPQALAR